MRKESILKRKMTRSYKSKKGREYSRYKGYPPNTFFGFETLKEMQKEYLKRYREFYGYTLRNLIYV